MSVRKITPILEKEILAKAAEGYSARAISVWLLEERNLKISAQGISKMLRQTRKTRADVAKVVVREALSGHVTTDLDRLGKSLERVCRLERRLHARAHKMLDTLDNIETGAVDSLGPDALKMAVIGAQGITEMALKASDRVRSIVDTKLHYAGADGKDSEDTAPEAMRAAQDELLGRLSRIAHAGEEDKDRPESVQH